MPSPRKTPRSGSLSPRSVSGNSGSGNGGLITNLFFVGIGMSVMGLMMRLRETTDLSTLTDLMATTTTSTTSSTTTLKATTSLKKTTTRRQHPDYDPNWTILQQMDAEQHGRVRKVAPLPQAPANADPNFRQVYFMDYKQFAEHDAFSASWLLNTDQFLTKIDIEGMGICEDAAFFTYNEDSGRQETLRMPMDWLDFSIEHLSKWNTMMLPYVNDIPFHFINNKLEEYMSRGKTYPVDAKNPVLKDTIAVIAFRRYKDKDHAPKARKTTITSLAATVESLRRAGMGRVVTVGMEDDDHKYAEEAYRLAYEKLKGPNDSDDKYPKKIGHMEVGFAQGHRGQAKTAYLELNIPKATLMGLRDAMEASKRGPVDDMEEQLIKTYLGDGHKAEDWKFVYLTEPDCILQTRPSTLPILKKYAEMGSTVIPHRLQPIPHESDVRGCARKDLYLQEEQGFPSKDIIELDSLDQQQTGMCCDAHRGPDFKPGLPPNYPFCGNFWYMCDFRKPDGQRHHKRIKEYQLIRLMQGTRITFLAGGEHGRPCIPSKSPTEVCIPPLVKALQP